MKKLLAWMLVFALGAALLTGCGSKQSEPEVQASETEAAFADAADDEKEAGAWEAIDEAGPADEAAVADEDKDAEETTLTEEEKEAKEIMELSANADYEGTFSDGNYDSVEFTVNPDGGYDAVVSIYRLTTMEGWGNVVDGAVELELEDANGNLMCANFHPAEDGTYSLIITQSQWNLLEEQTEFTGFAAE